MMFIQIRPWDYWFGVYGIGAFSDIPANSVEFSITKDQEGNCLFFHFDFYNLPALDRMIEQEEFMERESPDYDSFIKKSHDLKNGCCDFFVGGLYYKDYWPELAECNSYMESGKSIFEVMSPPCSPYYAVVFLREKEAIRPEVLMAWLDRILEALFGERITCEISDIPTLEEANQAYSSDGRFWPMK